MRLPKPGFSSQLLWEKMWNFWKADSAERLKGLPLSCSSARPQPDWELGSGSMGRPAPHSTSQLSHPTFPGRAVCPHCRFPICWWVLLGCQKAFLCHNCLPSDFLWPSPLSSCSLRCSWRSPSAHLYLVKFEDMFKQHMHLSRSPERGSHPNQEPGIMTLVNGFAAPGSTVPWCDGAAPWSLNPFQLHCENNLLHS